MGRNEKMGDGGERESESCRSHFFIFFRSRSRPRPPTRHDAFHAEGEHTRTHAGTQRPPAGPASPPLDASRRARGAGRGWRSRTKKKKTIAVRALNLSPPCLSPLSPQSLAGAPPATLSLGSDPTVGDLFDAAAAATGERGRGRVERERERGKRKKRWTPETCPTSARRPPRLARTNTTARGGPARTFPAHTHTHTHTHTRHPHTGPTPLTLAFPAAADAATPTRLHPATADRAARLAALGLAPGATLFALAPTTAAASHPPALRGGLMVKVKTLTGKEIEVDIEPSDSIARIKERVEEKEGIPPVQQRLIFAGKQMADEKAAREYGVEGGSVLHLVLALRGGGGR